jgi:hypothetical protein
MNRMVSRVFKVLGLSMIIMLGMDITFLVVDTITVNNKIETISTVIKDELSRHNYVPNEIVELFKSQIAKVDSNSRTAIGWDSNLDKDLTINGVKYKSLSQNSSSVAQYGEMMTLVIQVTMEPKFLTLQSKSSGDGNGSTSGGSTANGTTLGFSSYTYTREYIYDVPALRYLK